jgi:hypothetical protein
VEEVWGGDEAGELTSATAPGQSILPMPLCVRSMGEVRWMYNLISRVRVVVDNVELLVPTGPRVLWRFAAAAGIRRHLAVFAQRELKRQGNSRIGTGRKTLKTTPQNNSLIPVQRMNRKIFSFRPR